MLVNISIAAFIKKALFVKIVVFEQIVCFDSVNRCEMDASLTASVRLNPSA
jgi:hypothetical protein